MGNSIIMTGGAGGIDPDECTAGRPQVLSGYTAGVHGEDDPAPGSMPERGAWSSSVGMNGSATIPEGHHSGSGKVNGPVVTQRGAWATSVGMNSQVAIPEGYHNGSGKVSGPSISYQNADVSGTDRARATGTSAWGGVMCLGVRNSHYLNGVNWIQADIAGLQAANIREGIVIGGLTGSLKDMSVNHVPFDGASFSGVLVKGAEKCSWYNNSILRNAVEIAPLGIRLSYSRASGIYNKLCPKESITFTPFRSVKITTRYTGTKSGKGYCTVCLYDTNTSRGNILRSGSDDTLKYMTIDMPNVNTDYIGYLDVSGVNGDAFLTIHFTNSADKEYPDYFIRSIEFSI